MSTKSHIPKIFPAIILETLMVVRWRSVYDTHTHIHWHTRARARGISGGLSNVKRMMKNTVRDREDESFITRPYHSFHISCVTLTTTLTIRDTILHDTRWRAITLYVRCTISNLENAHQLYPGQQIDVSAPPLDSSPFPIVNECLVVDSNILRVPSKLSLLESRRHPTIVPARIQTFAFRYASGENESAHMRRASRNYLSDHYESNLHQRTSNSRPSINVRMSLFERATSLRRKSSPNKFDKSGYFTQKNFDSFNPDSTLL